MATAVDGAHFDALMAELDDAVRDLVSLVEADAGRWTRGRPGKWTAGQHAEHLAITLAATAEAFEQRLPQVLDGTLAPVPRRDPLEWLWISIFVGLGRMPRGARTPRRFEAGPAPDRAQTLDRVRREVERHRAVGRRLTAAQRDRLWIASVFVPRWHYRLAEMVRGHAVHVRHHRKQMAEIA